MNHLTQGILLLMKSAITGGKYELPDDSDLEQIYRAMARHNILPMGYLGARNCGVDRQNPVMQKFFLAYGKSLQISENQIAALHKIYTALDAEKIDYMPVKGCNMKFRYPYPELRQMGDADILIRTDQYGSIREIMRKLGFTEGVESDHELVWTSPALCVEFHKRLIPTYTKDYYRYYGDGWKLAARSEGTHFYMNSEDEFIYVFTHMAKHYRNGGIGFRQVMDLWVLLRMYPDMDMDYITGEMEKLSLSAFYENIRRTLDVWFGEREPDTVTDQITDYIYNSGCWGSMEKHEISSALENLKAKESTTESRFRWILQNTFPSVSRISVNYPIAGKYPFLLPAVWIWRWIDVICTRPKKIRAKYRSARELTDKNLTDFQKSLHAVGLDFRFDEE